MTMRSPRFARAVAACVLSFLVSGAAYGQGSRTLTLAEAISLAQSQGLQARAAKGARDAARGRDRVFNALYLPSLSIGGTAPAYTRSVTAVTQPDGSILYLPVELAQGALTARLEQRLPWTNTMLTFNSSLSQVQRSGTVASKTWSSTPYSIGISQPILRANTQRWDNWQQELRFTSAERRYLEAREDVASATAAAYFDTYAAFVGLRNATKNAATNDTLYNLNKGRYEVGRIGENDLLQSELALLRARSAFEDARIAFDRAQSQLRIVLGLAPGTEIQLQVTDNVPDFVVDTAIAVAQARRNSSLMTDAELAEVGAERAVSEARWNTGAGGNLSATYGYNATAATAPDAYKNLLDSRAVSLNVSIPVWQWGSHSASVQAAKADRESAKSTASLSRANVDHNARFAALDVSRARRTLIIAAKADTVGQKRYDVAYNRYIIGRINIDILYQAQTEKDQAVNAYVQALRSYWNSYYTLRKTTLYDFEAGRPIR
jgi:outer membrane protein TolC